MQDGKRLSEEALAEWLESPVTMLVLGVLRKAAEHNRRNVEAVLWETGTCDPARLGKVKAQCEMIEDMEGATADDWNERAEQFGMAGG